MGLNYGNENRLGGESGDYQLKKFVVVAVKMNRVVIRAEEGL